MEKEQRPKPTDKIDYEDPERVRRFNEFKLANRESVSKIGYSYGASVRTGQAVTEGLFEATSGDASKVTDVDIERGYQKYGYKKIR